MRQGAWFMLGMVGIVGASLSAPGCVAIEAGHEGVMVEQPFFFGRGGSIRRRRRPAVWVAPTTKVIEVDIRPLQYSEHFDIISAENAPCRLMRSLIANVVEGRTLNSSVVTGRPGIKTT